MSSTFIIGLLTYNIFPSSIVLKTQEQEKISASSKIEQQAKKMLTDLQSADRREREVRILSEAYKERSFTNQQMNYLAEALRSPVLYDKNPQQVTAFATQLRDLTLKQTTEDLSQELSLSKFEKLVEAVRPYQIKELSPVTVDERQVKSLHAQYEQEKQLISKEISTFDISQEHTLPVAKYLDVRISHPILSTSKVFAERGKNVEVFLGPHKDLQAYYSSKGYHPVAQLCSKSSTKFCVFASEDADQHKLVISGITSQSRLNHVLLQMKFLPLSFDSIAIRGSLSSITEQSLLDLQKYLAEYQPKSEPFLAFIGSSWLVSRELASYLHPERVKATTEDEQRKEVTRAMVNRNGYKIKDINDMFHFCCIKVKVQDEPKTIVAFKMPNGSLAGAVCKIVLDRGFTHLALVGAGGSLGKVRGGDLGALQMIEKSTYQGKELSLPKKSILKIDPKNLEDVDMREGCSNITVDSPLEEDRQWFTRMQKDQHTSVDVETHHIFKTILRHQRKDITVFPGLFISDVVGENPLKEKISAENAYKHFPKVVRVLFEQIGISR